MITASTDSLDAEIGRLTALPQTLAARLADEVARLGELLRDRVERNLSGVVLQRRSGRLAGSIAVKVQQSGLSAAATVSSDSPYAATHEYGGTIPARTILPQSARALAFPWRGRQRFFKRVQLPAITMPQRSFLRSALDDTAPEIYAAVAEAANQALNA